MTSLSSFLQAQQDKLRDFEIYWLLHHSQDPVLYPLTIVEEDWEEQYSSFKELQP